MSTVFECWHCSKGYHIEESTAVEWRVMYCSKECEDAEEARLKEGNEIVRKAQEENPLFEQEKAQQDLKHMPLSGLLNFVKKEN